MENTLIEAYSETQIKPLRSAINEGIESGIANDFDPAAHLKHLKETI